MFFVAGHFHDYQRLGDAAINVLNDFTPLVERISIDEAFADVKGCTHLFGSPTEIARTIRRRIRLELGLPISIGVARTQHLAKIASRSKANDVRGPLAQSQVRIAERCPCRSAPKSRRERLLWGQEGHSSRFGQCPFLTSQLP